MPHLQATTVWKSYEEELNALINAVPKPINAGIGIIDALRQKMMALGGRECYRWFRNTLLDIAGGEQGKKLSRPEIRTALEQYGVVPTEYEMDTLVRHFDKDFDCKVSVAEFMKGLRPSFPHARTALVAKAWALVIHATGTQSLSVSDLAGLYDVQGHPGVMAGQRNVKETREVFLESWKYYSAVGHDEFFDYYWDISSGIDNDLYFELMVRNTWRIGGGVGVAQCTTCRKVLVKLRNGRETVIQLKEDLGIGEDHSKLLSKVKEMGLVDAVQVQTQFVLPEDNSPFAAKVAKSLKSWEYS